MASVGLGALPSLVRLRRTKAHQGGSRLAEAQTVRKPSPPIPVGRCLAFAVCGERHGRFRAHALLSGHLLQCPRHQGAPRQAQAHHGTPRHTTAHHGTRQCIKASPGAPRRTTAHQRTPRHAKAAQGWPRHRPFGNLLHLFVWCCLALAVCGERHGRFRAHVLRTVAFVGLGGLRGPWWSPGAWGFLGPGWPPRAWAASSGVDGVLGPG